MSDIVGSLSKAKEVSFRKVDDEGVIYNLETGRLHVLNKTGIFVWEQLDEIDDLSEIAKRLASIYEIDQKQVFETLVPFVRDLIEQGLVIENVSN